MSKYCVIGQGFLGKAVAEKLGDTTWYPVSDTKKVFYFGGATHPDFDKNPEYWRLKMVTDVGLLVSYCKQHNLKLIYASSALVYEPTSPLGRFLLEIEGIMQKELPSALGLRIFPVTGPGGHTVIEEWKKNLENGERPKVWGDGEQTRDFIPLYKAVDKIVYGSDNVGVIDIGIGEPKSFNQILKGLCEEYGKPFDPEYIPTPEGYNIKGVIYGQK